VANVHEVRIKITFWWLIATAPAILIVIVQTVLGVFGNTVTDLFKGLGWILPLWTPVTTLILMPLSVTMEQREGTREFKNQRLRSILYIALGFYAACLYLVILLDRISMTIRTDDLFLWSSWTFLPIQVALIVLVTKVFFD
jgi:hypothetical protein